MNQQPVEKRVRDDTGTLQVHSIFYTIQGEGPFAGTPAVFVRLAGCNLQCPMCDTDYTSTRQQMSPQAILEAISDAYQGVREQHDQKLLVVITGGEPFRQGKDLAVLAEELCQFGYYVQIETNGTLPVSFPCNDITSDRSGCYIVVSPKTGKVHKTIWENACAVKYVGNQNELSEIDGLPELALNNELGNGICLARPPEGWNRPIYLQPMDWREQQFSQRTGMRDMNAQSLEACLQSCMKHGYIMCSQQHKIWGME